MPEEVAVLNWTPAIDKQTISGVDAQDPYLFLLNLLLNSAFLQSLLIKGSVR